MGIDQRIEAAPLRPDVRLVERVLARWKHHNPAQYKLAEFGLRYIQSEAPRKILNLDDGSAVEMRWICFGCLFEFVYGFSNGIERLVITKLTAQDCDPCSDIIIELNFVFFEPTGKHFYRVPESSDLKLKYFSHKNSSPPIISTEDTRDSGRSLLSFPFSGAQTSDSFALSWLPRTYLRAHVPRLQVQFVDFNCRQPASKIQELNMKNYNPFTVFSTGSALSQSDVKTV